MTAPLHASRKYFKGHGLGNDYLVFRFGSDWRVTAGSVRAVCDRWRGVGSDGIVVQLPSDDGPYRLRMFNPDGSEFERSGNGLRVFAACLGSVGKVGSDPFEVEVGGSRLRMKILAREPAGVYDVAVEMGRPSFLPEQIGLDTALLDAWGRIIHPEEGPMNFVGVSMGNPHCVVFTEDVSREALARLGPTFSTHPAFRQGTNVQLARPAGPSSIRALVWERGAGRTSSSGTSACAVAAAAVSSGMLAPGDVRVEMEGGELTVNVSPELDVILRGPVQEVCRGELTDGFLESLGAEGQES